MIRTQISISEEQMKLLKELSAKQGISIAELIRRSIDLLARTPQGISQVDRRKRALEAAGKFSSGEPNANVSLEHDKYLEEAYAS